MQQVAFQAQRVTPDTQKIHRVCFICTGNTCRSPMAAAVYNHLHKGEPCRAISCGTAAADGDPIHPNAVEALKKAGIDSGPGNDYEGHLSQPITRQIVDKADQLICLSSSHALAVLCGFPDCASKISVLGDIADPWGGDQDTYDQTLAQIMEALSPDES